MNNISLLLSSAGRRPYLVEWFQEALTANNVEGRIVVVDADTYAPSRGAADTFLVAPPVVSEEYDSWLAGTLEREGIDLAISINDFELSHWANLEAGFPAEDCLLRLTVETQRLVEDKLLMARALCEQGVQVPETQTGTLALSSVDPSAAGEYVTKGRFGSASRGLRMVTGKELPDVITDVGKEVTDAAGRVFDPSDPRVLDLFVVQERVRGEEYGLDVVSDLGGNHVGVLARRKITMRAGETDRAESVDAAMFEGLAEQITHAIPHRGSIDVDVIIDDAGEMWVIDVNPRFGGGYPFSHLAGANIPAAYVAWATEATPNPSWLRSTPGVVSSKFVGVARSQ